VRQSSDRLAACDLQDRLVHLFLAHLEEDFAGLLVLEQGAHLFARHVLEEFGRDDGVLAPAILVEVLVAVGGHDFHRLLARLRE
jgi:hypothetical protein